MKPHRGLIPLALVLSLSPAFAAEAKPSTLTVEEISDGWMLLFDGETTWVNGIQVTDVTDQRAPNENARQGYRAQPGVVNLQGHDPTTDLSFRNLCIAEMPAGKP